MTASVPNEIVRSWQKKLQAAFAAEGKPDPLPKYGADGIATVGGETQTALIAYQKAHGLPVTGQWDNATRAALDPPKPHVSIPPVLIELGIETAFDAVIPASPAKELLRPMFNNIVHIVLGLLPGLPDDYSKITASVQTLVKDAADNKGAAAELRDAAKFARILADEADKVANALDPAGAPPATPSAG